MEMSVYGAFPQTDEGFIVKYQDVKTDLVFSDCLSAFTALFPSVAALCKPLFSVGAV